MDSATNAPIAGTVVVALEEFQSDSNQVPPSSHTLALVKPDASGHFEFSNVTSKNHLLIVVAALMTPTIVVKGGKPFLVLGAPGGAKIISGILQVLVNVIDFGMNVQDAIDFPRVHHQWKPDRLDVEPGVSPDTTALLKQMGYELRFADKDGDTLEIGRVEAIQIKDGWLLGGHDGRGPGKAVGY